MNPRKTHITPVSENTKAPPERRLGSAHQQPVSILRYPFELLGQGLEAYTGREIVLGVNFPEELPRPPWKQREKYWYPHHYQPELGFPLMYLAFTDSDHARGPVVESAHGREPTWICCASPDGIRTLMEVYDATLERVVVRLLRTNASCLHALVCLTVCQVCPEPGFPKAVVTWMKHKICPKQADWEKNRTYSKTA